MRRIRIRSLGLSVSALVVGLVGTGCSGSGHVANAPAATHVTAPITAGSSSGRVPSARVTGVTKPVGLRPRWLPLGVQRTDDDSGPQLICIAPQPPIPCTAVAGNDRRTWSRGTGSELDLNISYAVSAPSDDQMRHSLPGDADAEAAVVNGKPRSTRGPPTN